MKDIFAEIERKNRAIWLVACLLVIYNVLRLLSIVWLPYSITQIGNIEVGISVSAYQVVFQNYIIEESHRLQMQPDSLKIIIFGSGCMAAAYIVSSLFLGMRKKLSRYIIINLILVEFIIDIVVGIKFSILPSKISIIIGIFLLLFLFSPNISKEFK